MRHTPRLETSAYPVLDQVARLAVRCCQSDWAAVYVDTVAVATAEAPGRPSARHVFPDLSSPEEGAVSPDRRMTSIAACEDEADLLDALLPPQAPRFLVATPLGTVPHATLCLASAAPRMADMELRATLADLIDLASSSVASMHPSVSASKCSAPHEIDAPATLPRTADSLSASDGDTHPLAFIEWDRDGQIVDWSPAAERMFGYSQKEARELWLLDIVAPADWGHVERVWKEQRQQNGGYFSYNANITREGEVILCEWHNTPIVNDGGEVSGLKSLVRDVTEREAQAAAIQERKEFAENLIVTMQDGILVFSPAGTTIQVNDAFCAMTGFSRDDVLGTSAPYPFWSSEEYESFCEAFDTSVGKETTHDLKLLKRDGTRLPVVMHNSVVRGPSGEVVCRVASIRDVSREKVAERGLERERDLLQTIFDAIPVMIVVHDPEESLLHVNRAFEETVGGGEAHLPGADVKLDLDDRAAIRSFVSTLSSDWMDVSVTRSDDDVVESSWIGVEGGDGRTLAIGIDVTERTRRAEALRRARDEAEEMNRLKSSFLANMSHEIRTPLTAILGFSEMIRETLQQPDIPASDLTAALNFVLQIERGGRRLLDTLDSVLNLSRLEAGTMTVNSESVDVAAILQETVGLVHDEAGGAALDITVRVLEEPTVIEADPVMLRRVLEHVIGNAVKFTPSEGTVACDVQQRSEEIRIVIEDDGIGIDPTVLENVCQPFVQESSGLSRSFEGNGLGLAVTAGLVELMQGSVEIESEKGTGTRVTLTFPRR